MPTDFSDLTNVSRIRYRDYLTVRLDDTVVLPLEPSQPNGALDRKVKLEDVLPVISLAQFGAAGDGNPEDGTTGSSDTGKVQDWLNYIGGGTDESEEHLKTAKCVGILPPKTYRITQRLAVKSHTIIVSPGGGAAAQVLQ